MKLRAHHAEALTPPRIDITRAGFALHGHWTLACMRPRLHALRRDLASSAAEMSWDLSGVERLDAFGALLLWRTWGQRYPEALVMPGLLVNSFERIQHPPEPEPPPPPHRMHSLFQRLGQGLLEVGSHVRGMIELIGHVTSELWRLPQHPGEIPWVETSAAAYKTGVQALPVAALLGFLIGIVLSYLSALQLQNFGAETFLINILGFGVIRELGPVLVAILVAGRSGSAITAQLGVMRVTEEIDALAAMGVSRHQRLILPKVVALTLAMPLLVAWTSGLALVGGALAAKMQLNIDIWNFFERLPTVVPLGNIGIGLGKGAVFGMTIAMIGCHYGLRVKPNTESLSTNTTASVVSSITAVIIIDAIFAVLTRTLGVPR
ncbi:ABC transporter permease [Uliginosibacterium sp. H3]|uniref:ABC transporter permease n=1 Tax=Uliginosibacterium silvisoli TaxID=3114758 RepID=A0ABU6K4V7_9RHOO|nr:ABC transporter permease [Uliginosibacterium sp. H3]